MLEDERQFESLHAALKSAGVAFESLSDAECKARGLGRATRTVEPNLGAPLECYLLPEATGPKPFVPTLAMFQRLAPATWPTPHYARAHGSIRDMLNLAKTHELG